MSDEVRQRTPLDPIFRTPKLTGSIAVGNSPGSPNLPSPVLAYDSRDWTGGAAIPTSSQQTPIDVGTIANTGTAGGDYDISVWLRFFENGVNGWTNPDRWEVTQAYLSTFTATDPFTIPGTFIADLGGTPMSTGWTICAVATTEPASATLDLADEIYLDIQDNSGSTLQILQRIKYSSTSVIDYQGLAYNAGDSGNYNNTVVADSSAAPVFLAGVFNAETGDGTFWIDATEATLDTQDQNLSAASASAIDAMSPDAVEIGWGSFNATETQPVKANGFPGLFSWRLYRGILTADQVAAVRADMEA